VPGTGRGRIRGNPLIRRPLCDAGRYAEALEAAQTSARLASEIGDRYTEAAARNTLGGAHRGRADTLFTDIGAPNATLAVLARAAP